MHSKISDKKETIKEIIDSATGLPSDGDDLATPFAKSRKTRSFEHNANGICVGGARPFPRRFVKRQRAGSTLDQRCFGSDEENIFHKISIKID